MTEQWVIVGGGLAGAQAVQQLRADGFAGRIVLVGAERELPYERPPLSKDLLLGTGDRQKAFVHSGTWYDEHDVTLVQFDVLTLRRLRGCQIGSFDNATQPRPQIGRGKRFGDELLNTERTVDRSWGGTPVLVQLQARSASSDHLLERCRTRGIALAGERQVNRQPFRCLQHARHVPGPWCAGSCCCASGRTGATADQSGDA